jgi:hypothetical protein
MGVSFYDLGSSTLHVIGHHWWIIWGTKAKL